MTKYILNSGGIRNGGDYGATFFAEIVSGLGDHPKILFCFFAEKRENWEEKFKNYKQGFLDLMPKGVEPVFDLAFPEKFVQQLKENDAVYIHGGDDHLLLHWLKQFDLPTIWENKVVATNSASSHALSKYFWTCDWRQCKEGLGILPIKFIAHYKSSYGADDPRGPVDWQKAYDELKAYGKIGLPIYALKEGAYEIFTL